MMEYRDSKRKPVRIGDTIGRGGEATIYKVRGQDGLLAKVYALPPRDEYARKLTWMVEHPPDDPTAAQQHASLAWPVDLLFERNGQLTGYLMPYIERAVTLLDVFNPRQRAHILPEFNRRYLHRAARNLSAALGALHARGYVVGDINESNILVTPRALVTMIDTDSFQVRELRRSGSALIYPCPVARQEYTPPELQGRSLKNIERSSYHDDFGLAVLIYQLLMEGNHPFRAQWLGSGEPPPLEERIRLGCFPYRQTPVCPVAPPPNAPGLEELHPSVTGLMLRCFVDGYRRPQRRPSPEQWEQALGEAEMALTLCNNGHYYSNHLSECPICRPRARGRQFPLPAIPIRDPAQSPVPSRSKPAARSSRPISGSPSKTPSSRQPSSPQPAPGASPPSQVGALSGGQFLQPNFSYFLLRLARYFQPGSTSVSRSPRQSIPLRWQVLLTGLGHGALLGAGSGAAGVGLLAILAWVQGQGLGWNLLWGVGAALGAGWRSQQIGKGLNRAVTRTVGWELVLHSLLALILAVSGAFTGLLMTASVPAAGLGVLIGGVGGWLLGDVIWVRFGRIRWDMVWTGAVMLLFGWLGFLVGSWIGAGWLGQTTGDLMFSLANWAAAHNISWFWLSTLAGALGGAAGGAVGGGLTETLAALLGLRK